MPTRDRCDALANGQRIKEMTIVDDFTKEPIDLVAEQGISGHYVDLILPRTAQFRGLPLAIRTDPGPEITGKALGQRGYQNGVQLKISDTCEVCRKLPEKTVCQPQASTKEPDVFN